MEFGILLGFLMVLRGGAHCRTDSLGRSFHRVSGKVHRANFRGDTACLQLSVRPHGKVSQAGSSCGQVVVKPNFMAAKRQKQEEHCITEAGMAGSLAQVSGRGG